jgi:hypothetical protein
VPFSFPASVLSRARFALCAHGDLSPSKGVTDDKQQLCTTLVSGFGDQRGSGFFS